MILTPRTVDTYTAQANLGDVNKGITNHKVCPGHWHDTLLTPYLFCRISSPQTNLCWSSEMAMEEEDPFQLCWKMYAIHLVLRMSTDCVFSFGGSELQVTNIERFQL